MGASWNSSSGSLVSPPSSTSSTRLSQRGGGRPISPLRWTAAPDQPSSAVWFPPSFQTLGPAVGTASEIPRQRLSSLWSQRSEGLRFSLGIEFTAPHALPSYSSQIRVFHSALPLDLPQHPEFIPTPGPLHWWFPLPGRFFPQMSFPPSLHPSLPRRLPYQRGFPCPPRPTPRSFHSAPLHSFLFLPCTLLALYIT